MTLCDLFVGLLNVIDGILAPVLGIVGIQFDSSMLIGPLFGCSG